MKVIDFGVVGGFMMISVLVGVGFFTLLERKVLSYLNNRKGPNKVGIMGLGQPISDGLKLFGKEYLMPHMSVFFIFFVSPMMIFLFSFISWMCIPLTYHLFDFDFSLLFFLCLAGFSVYALIFSGWSSNSKYAIYGSYRGVAQTISYEVSLAMIMLCFVFLVGGYSLESFSKYQFYIWNIFFMLPLGMVWFVSSLAETNRTPFDFTEGESELVSGFNIEYSGLFFILLFIGEYVSILFMGNLYVILFMGGLNGFYSLKVMGVIFIFILVRGSLPRFRYDNLMYLAWKMFLPMSINFLIFCMGIKMYMHVYML